MSLIWFIHLGIFQALNLSTLCLAILSEVLPDTGADMTLTLVSPPLGNTLSLRRCTSRLSLLAFLTCVLLSSAQARI